MGTQRAITLSACVAIALTVAACTQSEQAEFSASDEYTVVPVLYGTDRNYTGAEHPRDKYGPERGEEVSWGRCEVSIPTDHRMGELESPSLWRL